MRLVCPNCGAQYEIDASLVPPDGRDVQCSNCGHGWFQPAAQTHREAADAAEPDFPPDARLHDAARQAAIGGVVPNAPITPTRDSRSDPSPEAEMDALLQALDAAVEAENPSARRTSPVMDIARAGRTDDLWADEEDHPRPLTAPRPSEDVMAILRSEAARESAARRAEAEAQAHFDEQAELDMAPPPRRAPIQADPDVPVGAPHSAPPFSNAGEDARLAAASQVAGQGDARRQSRFPSIEDVSAHLGNAVQTRGKKRRVRRKLSVEELAERYSRRQGMRIGFSAVVAVSALAVVLYGQAPALAAQVPALAEPLDGYVDWINGLRVWVDRAARAAARMIGA